MRSIYLPPWRIDTVIRPGVEVRIAMSDLARVARAALAAAGAPAPASLGLILSNDAELADLNRAHMGEDGPTDVLSFPLLQPADYPAHTGQDRRAARRPAGLFALPPGRRQHLGDVVVSVERARAQAEQGRAGQSGDLRSSAADELRLLVVHGVLHVCGWDHALPAERDAMRTLEMRLLP